MQATTGDVFFALGQPTRLAIVDMLSADGALTASEISRQFRSTPSAISQHLRVLKEAGLVTVRKRAQHRLYQLDGETMASAEGWIAERRRSWDARMNRLEAVLENAVLASREEKRNSNGE